MQDWVFKYLDWDVHACVKLEFNRSKPSGPPDLEYIQIFFLFLRLRQHTSRKLHNRDANFLKSILHETNQKENEQTTLINYLN